MMSLKTKKTKLCFKTFLTYIIKLYNFSSIWTRSTVKIVMESFEEGQHQYKQKVWKLVKFGYSQSVEEWTFLPRDLPASEFETLKKAKCVPCTLFCMKATKQLKGTR